MKYNIGGQLAELDGVFVENFELQPVGHSVPAIKNRSGVVIGSIMYILHEKHNSQDPESPFYNKVQWIIDLNNASLFIP